MPSTDARATISDTQIAREAEAIETATYKSDPKRRRWHWSTWIIIVVLVIAAFLVDFPARSVIKQSSSPFWPSESRVVVEHGWPLTYRVRQDEPLVDPAVWSFDFGDSDWHFGNLIVNLLCAGAIGGLVVVVWERRRRKRGTIWRFSLREAIALVTLVAIGTGCWKAASDRTQELEELLRGTNTWLPSIRVNPHLPIWLRQLVGDENLDWFPFRDPATEWSEPVYVSIPKRSYGGVQTDAEIKLRTETLLRLVAARPDFFGVDLGLQWPSQQLALDFVRRAPRLRHVCSQRWTSELLAALSECNDLCTFIDNDSRFNFDSLRGKKNEQLPTAADAKTLCRSRHLKTLVLPPKSVTAEMVAILTDLPELDSLEFRRSPIGHAGWEQIGRMNGLRRLSAAKCELTDADLEPISRLPCLEELDVEDSEITDAGIDALSRCVSLRRLDLSGTDVTKLGLGRLSKLPKLNDLSIANTHTNDASLAPLSQFTGLQRLDISASDVQTIESFNCAGLPRLRTIVITYCPIIRSSVTAWPARFPNVSLVEVYGLNDTMPPASRIYNNQTFADFVESDRAELCHPEVTNGTLRDFVAWAKRNQVLIRQVMLGQARISDDGLAALSDLPELTELDLADTAVTPAGVAQLVSVSSLEIVGLDPAQLDERSVAALKRLPHLKEVHMWTQRYREAKRVGDRFKKELPQLEWFHDDFDGPIPVVG